MSETSPAFTERPDSKALALALDTLAQHSRRSLLLDGIAVLAERLRLILGVTLLAGVAAFGVALWLPKTYTSVAFLGPMDEMVGRGAEGVIHSAPVLDPIIEKFPQYKSGYGLEDKRKLLSSSLRWETLGGADPKAAIFSLSFGDTDPVRAQSLLAALLDRWLETRKPGPDTSARLEKALEASEAQAADLSQVIAELKKRPDAMFADGHNGYFPPNIVDMIKMRTETASRIVDLTMALRAGSHDLIFSPPTLPQEPSGPRKKVIVFAAMVGVLVALIAFLLLRWGLGLASEDPAYAPTIARIRKGFAIGF